MKDKKLWTLYLYYTVYFLAIGATVYSSKYYGEIGLSDSQIGLIVAVPAFVAMFVQPLWGSLADRAKYMRSVLFVALVVAGLLCFLVPTVAGNFLPMLLVLTLYSTFTLPAMPVGNAISIEYTSTHGHDFGPVRMMGTVGYQVSILVMGLILASSLSRLYPLLGVMTLLAAGCALLLPPVKGYQHGKKRVSFLVFFKDPTLRLLFFIVFIGQVAGQFAIAFFSKHLGDLGFNNQMTGVISVLSVILEIPCLLFGDKLMKKLPIWSWVWIGLAMAGLRFSLLAVVRHPVLIVMAQMLGISQLACFEFFPYVYLGRVAEKELLSTVQSTYQMISFGVARIVGNLLGGFVADATSIPTVFAINGAMLLAVAAILFVPLRRKAALERQKTVA